MIKMISPVLFRIGPPLLEKKGDVKTSVIGGKRIKEKEGKLSSDLGKPAMSASEAELASYVDAAKSPSEKRKRVARINLLKAHRRGLRAKGTPPKNESSFIMVHESTIRPAVVKAKYR